MNEICNCRTCQEIKALYGSQVKKLTAELQLLRGAGCLTNGATGSVFVADGEQYSIR